MPGPPQNAGTGAGAGAGAGAGGTSAPPSRACAASAASTLATPWERGAPNLSPGVRLVRGEGRGVST